MTAFANSVCFKIAEKKFETLSKANFYTPLVWFQTNCFFFHSPCPGYFSFQRTFPLFFLVSREGEVNTRESVLTPPPAWNHLIPFQGQTCLGRQRIKRRNCPESNFSKKMLFLLLLYKVTVQLMTLLSGGPYGGCGGFSGDSDPSLSTRPSSAPPPHIIAHFFSSLF